MQVAPHNLDHVQIIPMVDAQVCASCESISNSYGDCPACGGSVLYAVKRWIEKTPAVKAA